MRFSIVIPVHNAQGRIDTIINRLKEQTFKDFQTVYVCDNCEDDSFGHIARTHEGALVVETSFGNDGLARSRGLDVAKGEWVLFIDDDDDWNSNHVLEDINRFISNLEATNTNADVICCGFNWVNGGGECKPLAPDGGIWSNVWSKIWKREAIGDTRFPEVYPDADAQFTFKMFDKKIRVALWDYSFYNYNYMREGSISWKERTVK